MPNSESIEDSRWACKSSGCDKSFARKEHLTRHERTHLSGDNAYVCKVCSRKFNRSDSLQRHLVRHGDKYKAYPSGRSKRACVTCHKGKIKCDGGQPCSKCHSKGIVCHYDDSPERAASLTRGSSSNDVDSENSSRTLESTTQSSPRLYISSIFHADAQDIDSSDLESRLAPFFSDSPAKTKALHLNVASDPEVSDGNRLFDWSNIRIRKDPTEESPEVWEQNEGPPTPPDGSVDEYMNGYFAHFHHRWPIVHRPALEEGDRKLLSRSSILMIGGWLSASKEGREYGLAMHEYLMLHMSTNLSQITSRDVFQDTFPSSLAQAALLNIIFALHTGVEVLVSRAVFLRNTLVTVLREVGFFRPETTWADEKPGTFVPFHLSLAGERQRLAAYLFKVDSYLGLIRNQPTLLTNEDLHYILPSTFAVWNSNGLDVFAARILHEPQARSRISMSERFNNIGKIVMMTPKESILIEDVQLYTCALQPSIAKFWRILRSNCYKDDPSRMRDDCPRGYLDGLGQHLDRFSHQIFNDSAVNSESDESLPLKHYFGYEEPVEQRRHDSAIRAKDLLFDALMLNRILLMNLNSDVQLFSQIAKDYCNTTGMPLPDRRRQERERRVCSATTWTPTSLARRSLFHAAEVLVLHQRTKDFDTKTADPIAYVALTTAALVIWAYCTFGGAMPPNDSDPPVEYFAELTKWCGARENGKEAWVKMGAGCPIEIRGVRLCSANIPLLMKKYRSLIPEVWELADLIAPGIFARHEETLGV